MARVEDLLASLSADASPKQRFARLEVLAKQLEGELVAAGPVTTKAPKWIHCSDRMPRTPGRYPVIEYHPKGDGKVFKALPADATGKFILDFANTAVAYWLEGLVMPGSSAPKGFLAKVLPFGRPGAARQPPPMEPSAPGRVEKFIESLPAYFADGPKTRVRFLESFAKLLESELAAVKAPPAIPKWVYCAEREPASAGKYAVVTGRTAAQPTAIDVMGYSNGGFSSATSTDFVLYWLEGLEMPPFHRLPSNALNPGGR